MSDLILETHALSKRYQSLGTPALSDVDLSVRKGRIVGLLGPNGSGKTTLIKMIAGLLTPTSGELLIDGKAPGTETKAIVSYLPDHNFLTGWMTVEETINYHADFFADFRRDRALDMTGRLGLDLRQKTKTLSKGNQEKLELILCMSRDAKLYLLDEPIAGVDPATRDYIIETILSNYSEDSTVLISTHLISDVEPALEDVIFLRNGEVLLQSTVDDIREQHGTSVDGYFREVFKW